MYYNSVGGSVNGFLAVDHAKIRQSVHTRQPIRGRGHSPTGLNRGNLTLISLFLILGHTVVEPGKLQFSVVIHSYQLAASPRDEWKPQITPRSQSPTLRRPIVNKYDQAGNCSTPPQPGAMSTDLVSKLSRGLLGL